MHDRDDMNTLPPDRSHIGTEQRHPASVDLDAMAVADCVDLMIDDHADVQRAVRSARDSIVGLIDALVPRLQGGGRLIYLGAGTSGRLGVLDASECPPTFQSSPNQIVGLIAGGDSSLRRSSEHREDDPDGAAEDFHNLALTEDDTVLGIAAGGTTPYVLGGLRLAREARTMTALLTCASMGKALEVDHLIALDTGPEVLTGSTRLKAGSATKLVLNIITTTTFVRLGKAYGHFMVDLRATNDKLTDRALRILVTLCDDLDRADARGLLDRAGGNLKAALVMHHRNVDHDAAEGLLDQSGGNLRALLGPPPRVDSV